MDVDFIQSVARVGDYLEIGLSTGNRLEGVLEELTLKRLTLRASDGELVAVVISSVVTAKARSAVAVSHPPAETALARPASLSEPEPVGHEPTPPSERAAVEDEPTPLPRTPEPAAPKSADPALIADRLARVSDLSVLPLDFDIYVTPVSREQLRQIRNSYEYAERVHELAPRYGRVGKLYTRTTYLWNAERENAELTRLMGALALLKEDVESARRYVALAADSGDVAALRLLAITAARRSELDVAVWALHRYFASTAADNDPVTWEAFVELLEATGERGTLAELLQSSTLDETAKHTVRQALADAPPAKTQIARPKGVVPRPPTIVVSDTVVPSARKSPPQVRFSAQRRAAEIRDPYMRAKDLELRVGDLPAAQAAYHEAIRSNVRRESAVKDLAWLTRRLDGPDAALYVINEQYKGYVNPGNALDNILIDFLTGARRYKEALVLLQKQANRTGLTTTKRYHLTHQIAYVKLADRQDSTPEWEELLSTSPENSAAQRGLAMALIQRGGPEDLDRAEQLVAQNTDQQSAAIRNQLAALREGAKGDAEDWVKHQLHLLGKPGFGDTMPPLVTYVMKNYSDLAARTREQRARESLPVTTRDVNPLAELGRQSRDAGTRAGAYLSAAQLAGELNDSDAQQYIYLGLTSLAESVMARQEKESARDLYCAALVAADERDDGESREVRAALTGYLRSHSGGRASVIRRRDGTETRLTADEVSQVLNEEIRTHGQLVFDLLPRLMADTGVARELVLDAVFSRKDLLNGSLSYLTSTLPNWTGAKPEDVRAGWHLAGEHWGREQSRLSHSLTELELVELSDTGLESALVRLDAVEKFSPQHLQEGLTSLTEAIHELRRYFVERSFEERENSLRRANGILRTLREGIVRGPNNLLVELVEPVAERFQTLIEQAQEDLHQTQPPAPQLTLALEETRSGQDGKVTVQIKVANDYGGAPLASPELMIGADPRLFSVDEPTISLPTIRGGDHQIEVVRIKVTDRARKDGAFSMPVTLFYRPRSSDEHVKFDANLPVRLAGEAEFRQIHNPFRDGATGVPVVNREMFFGRDELIDKIRARLREAMSPGVGVAVFGQKRAGKSSIRLHLVQRLKDEDRLLVADIGNIGKLAPQSDDVSNVRVLALLMWNVLERAEKELARYYAIPVAEVGLLPPELDREKFLRSPVPVDDCASLLEEYWTPEASHPPLTVVIDEFQYIDEWIRSGLLSSSFMQALKALIERRIFHLVIVGQAALDRLIQADPNTFGVFSTERVTYLAEPHAKRLVEIPIQIEGASPGSGSRYREKAVNRILELTGGSAFYIQRFCYKLVEYMNAERAPVVTEADVERVHNEFLGELEVKDFDNLESPGYTDPGAFKANEYRDVLLAIARASRNQAATMAAIQEAYQGPRLQELLEDLVLRDVVRRDSGAYRIVVRLYHDWLLKYHGTASGARSL